MNSLFIGLLIICINNQTAESSNKTAPIVFGEIGGNVTMRVRVHGTSSLSTYISWYRLSSSGKVERLAYFGSFSTAFGRYSGHLPSTSGAAYLNVSGVKIGDSGRFFVTVGSTADILPGTSSLLVITDPKVVPVMRVFLSGTGTVLCELKGGGREWSDPYWEIDDAENGSRLLKPEAEYFIDEHGAFIRSSILSLKNEIRSLYCACQHSNGLIIRTQVHQDSRDQCQLLLYLSPLAVVLLLVTVTASGLWGWRRRKQRPGTGMESNGRI